MNRYSTAIACLLTCAVVLERGLPARADDTVPVIKTPYRKFKIPFNIPTDQKDLYESLELWLSRDEGKTWKRIDRVTPQVGVFVFRSESDGLFWFAVRTRDKKGQENPRSNDEFQPRMKILIESEVPKPIVFEPIPAEEAPEPISAPVINLQVATKLFRSRIMLCVAGGLAGLR